MSLSFVENCLDGYTTSDYSSSIARKYGRFVCLLGDESATAHHQQFAVDGCPFTSLDFFQCLLPRSESQEHQCPANPYSVLEIPTATQPEWSATLVANPHDEHLRPHFPHTSFQIRRHYYRYFSAITFKTEDGYGGGWGRGAPSLVPQGSRGVDDDFECACRTWCTLEIGVWLAIFAITE
jgi:hypothetical protein